MATFFLTIIFLKIIRRDRSAGTVDGGCLVYIYRPPCDNISTFSSFFNHFFDTLEKVWLKYSHVVMVRDFNCDFVQREGDIIN